MNPFSATAVARVTGSTTDFFTIRTAAVDEAVGALVSALRADGTVTVGLVGDHGTGKTHLCVELLREAHRSAPDRVRTVYLDAPAATFTALHRSFAAALPHAELTAAARSMPGSPSDLLPRTGFDHPDLVLCLGMLTDDDQAAVAWDWLCGLPPAPALVARGVTGPVSSERLAIEVMSALATLLHHTGHRLVLAIDEIEKVLSAASRGTTAAVEAFRDFLTAFAGTGAVLVLAGVPDWLQVLDHDIRQRISTVIGMSPMSTAETVALIRTAYERADGSPRLTPFSAATAEYITQLADGVPRRVVRMCYQLHRRAESSRSPVSFTMVREVMRTYFDLISTQEVRTEVHHVLGTEGRLYERDRLLGPMRDLPVDFWVPVPGGSRAGCCIVLTEEVLKSDEVDGLVDRARRIREAAGPVEILLIVVRYLPPELERQLAAGFGADPIAYDPRTFADDLSTAVQALTGRLERLVGVDPLTTVQSGLERVTRQHSRQQRSVDQVTVQFDELRQALDQQFAALRRTLAAGREDDLPDAPDESPAQARQAGLADRVATPFDTALAALDGIARVDLLFRDAFRTDDRGGPRSDASRFTVRSLIRSAEVLPALGVMALLRGMVETFRDSVTAWLSRPGAGLADTAGLDALCARYESEFEEVPLYRLDGLSELAARRSGHVDTVGQLVWAQQRVEVRQTLETLAVRVRTEVLRALAAGPDLRRDPGGG